MDHSERLWDYKFSAVGFTFGTLFAIYGAVVTAGVFSEGALSFEDAVHSTLGSATGFWLLFGAGILADVGIAKLKGRTI